MYEDWQTRYYEAMTQIYPDPYARAKAFESLNNEVEKDLVLLGATALEDKLQDGVPECITTLASAGIKIWVLTGDKMETAINVGFLCGLLKTTETADDLQGEDADMILIQVKHANGEDEVNRQMRTALDRFFGKGSGETIKRTEYALIIDGQSLKFAMDSEETRQLFLELGCRCKAVVCCRVSPLQKAKVVELVKREKGVMTLAIGDGANDVSMIQSADVGVGISGEEGLQAAMSADYAIAQFRFLKKLLLVHGRWNYSRVAYMILNFYLKSIMFSLVIFWYQFHCGFSSAVIYEFTYMLLYNIVFTNFPVIALGIFDKDLESNAILAYPPLYASEGISRMFYTHRMFSVYFLESIYQSLICYFVPMWTYRDGSYPFHGYTLGTSYEGTVMAFCAILIANLSVALDLHSWNWVMHLALWGTIIIFPVYIIVLGSIESTMLTTLLYQDPSFWCVAMFCTILALGPRWCYYAVRRMFKPCDSDIISEIQYVAKQRRTALDQFTGSLKILPESATSPMAGVIAEGQLASVEPIELDQSMVPQSPLSLRRASNVSRQSFTVSMETGDMTKAHGFSFSHTRGMGEVLLKSPLSILSKSLRPSSRLGGGNSRSYRFGWPTRPTSASGNREPVPTASTNNVTSPTSTTSSHTSPIERTTKISINEPPGNRRISHSGTAPVLTGLLAPIMPKSKSSRDMTVEQPRPPAQSITGPRSKSQTDLPRAVQGGSVGAASDSDRRKSSEPEKPTGNAVSESVKTESPPGTASESPPARTDAKTDTGTKEQESSERK